MSFYKTRFPVSTYHNFQYYDTSTLPDPACLFQNVRLYISYFVEGECDIPEWIAYLIVDFLCGDTIRFRLFSSIHNIFVYIFGKEERFRNIKWQKFQKWYRYPCDPYSNEPLYYPIPQSNYWIWYVHYQCKIFRPKKGRVLHNGRKYVTSFKYPFEFVQKHYFLPVLECARMVLTLPNFQLLLNKCGNNPRAVDLVCYYINKYRSKLVYFTSFNEVWVEFDQEFYLFDFIYWNHLYNNVSRKAIKLLAEFESAHV